MKLYQYQGLPEGLLSAQPTELYKFLQGPMLIELPGKNPRPLFISTLLHGNETTGFLALQKLLAKYHSAGSKLPRTLLVFIGNIWAAKENMRRLPEQADYNRIWNGGKQPEHQMALNLLDQVRDRKLFACIDVHNNTGENPYYACVNRFDHQYLNLAKLFSKTVVYFIRPEQVLSLAFAKICPSVTIEAGQSGDMLGVDRVYDFIEHVMHMDHIPDTTVTDRDALVYHSVSRINVPDSCRISFNDYDKNADIRFISEFELLNFNELPEHTLMGHYFNKHANLIVTDEQGTDVTDEFIRFENGEIRTRRQLIPSMFCSDERIIRQDCLGYFMQRYTLE